MSSAVRKILVVDDDREMVAAVQRVLRAAGGYEVTAAYDGAAALKALTETKPDLVILDVKMPGMDGFAVCENIRKTPLNKGVKIIVVSGVLDMDGMERLMVTGADDYLTKPFRNEFLLMKISRVLSPDPDS